MDSTGSPEIERMVRQLLNRYQALRSLTVQIRQQVESDDSDALGSLDGLVVQRESLVAEAEHRLSEVLRQREALLPEMVRQLEKALGGVLEEDARLRSTLSASVQEVPRQLARLHSGRVGLAAYQASVIGRSEIVDRNG